MAAPNQPDQPPEDPAGQGEILYGHFRVLWREGKPWELGRGAMGVTYKAVDINLDAPVALKLIRCQDLGEKEMRARFVREAKAAAALRHPHVATVFHLGEQEGDFFYAMEFVEGETLEAKIRREGMLPPVVALSIARQVASALAAAARLGIVHRDIKPSNIMLQTDAAGDQIHAKVIDFGLAKTVENTSDEAGETRTMLTRGGFLGTPHFASPEQLEEKELDARSDIYSLGVTLFYMLAGQTPFSGSIAQVMSQHLYREPPMERLANQPPSVLRLVEKLLQKDPANRPADGGEVVRLIDETVELLPSAGKIPTAPPPPAPEEESTVILPGGITQPTSSEVRTAGGRTPGTAQPSSSRRPLLAGALILFLVVAAGGFFLFLTFFPPTENGTSMDDSLVDTSNESAAPAEDAVAAPTPEEIHEPGPSPRDATDELSDRLATALALEAEDPAASLLMLAGLAREFPTEEEPRARLERRLARLEIEFPQGIPAEDLPRWRTALEEAAELDLISANYLLAESIFRLEPESGLRHFLRAAEGGHVESMVRAGSMLSAARGVPAPDMEQAVRWFTAAAEKNHPLALTLLADCYLRGLGVPEADPTRAIELLESASALGEPRAMDLLGHLYREGVGLESPNLERAYELFSRAAALGHLDAQGNLGIMVMLGEATPRNPARAMALWNEGARQGNDTCMFFYAQTLEDPELGNDPVAAAIWYARAARLGHPGAIAWCEKRGLAWQDPEPSPATSPATNAAPDPTIRPSAEPGNGPDPTAD